MTTHGRKEHMIPVVLDSQGAAGVVGISSTIGRIDLSTAWTELLATKSVDNVELLKAIRNPYVLPVLEKLDDSPS